MTDEHSTITDAQRVELCAMVGAAFVEIRRLGWQAENAEQAGSLADAFHNVPTEMWNEHFSLLVLRDAYLFHYNEKYPEQGGCDFVSWVNEIILMHKR